jgi:hypothetical protein
MREAHIELSSVRCPRCAGDLLLRVMADERGSSVLVTLDTACAACGTSPWDAPDLRTVLFTPGAGIDPARQADAAAALAAAQGRIDSLLRRVQSLEGGLASAHRNLERARASDLEAGLREEISRLEGQLAEARAEVRRAEEATRGEVSAGKRPIEVE